MFNSLESFLFRKNYKEVLTGILQLLPEPILVVGNKIPDGDSVGCISALLDFCRGTLGKEIYTYFVDSIPDTLSWGFDEGDFTSPPQLILEDYNSLIVVDDYVGDSRLGIQIKDVPILNLDHHLTNSVVENAEFSQEFFIEDPDIYLVVQSKGKMIHIWGDVPATACLLVAGEIVDPLLLVSIHQDSYRFRVKPISSVKWANRLCNQLTERVSGFTDLEAERILRKSEGKLSRVALDRFLNSKVYVWHGKHKEQERTLVLATVKDEDQAYWGVLSSFRMFSDITIVVSETTGKTSIRTDLEEFEAHKIAQRFGGGGHSKAAGLTLDPNHLVKQMDRLVETVLVDFENPGVKVYL